MLTILDAIVLCPLDVKCDDDVTVRMIRWAEDGEGFVQASCNV